MTSSNGNLFRIIGPLWGEFTGHNGQWHGALMFSLIIAWKRAEQTIQTPMIWDTIALLMTSLWWFTWLGVTTYFSSERVKCLVAINMINKDKIEPFPQFYPSHGRSRQFNKAKHWLLLCCVLTYWADTEWPPSGRRHSQRHFRYYFHGVAAMYQNSWNLRCCGIHDVASHLLAIGGASTLVLHHAQVTCRLEFGSWIEFRLLGSSDRAPAYYSSCHFPILRSETNFPRIVFSFSGSKAKNTGVSAPAK